jgi:hypothetical protein
MESDGAESESEVSAPLHHDLDAFFAQLDHARTTRQRLGEVEALRHDLAAAQEALRAANAAHEAVRVQDKVRERKMVAEIERLGTMVRQQRLGAKALACMSAVRIGVLRRQLRRLGAEASLVEELEAARASSQRATAEVARARDTEVRLDDELQHTRDELIFLQDSLVKERMARARAEARAQSMHAALEKARRDAAAWSGRRHENASELSEMRHRLDEMEVRDRSLAPRERAGGRHHCMTPPQLPCPDAYCARGGRQVGFGALLTPRALPRGNRSARAPQAPQSLTARPQPLKAAGPLLWNDGGEIRASPHVDLPPVSDLALPSVDAASRGRASAQMDASPSPLVGWPKRRVSGDIFCEPPRPAAAAAKGAARPAPGGRRRVQGPPMPD